MNHFCLRVARFDERAMASKGGARYYKSDAERVAFLFTLYQRITGLLPPAVEPRRGRKKG